MNRQFLDRLAAVFPTFAATLGDGSDIDLEKVQPPATATELCELEQSLGIPLPESYKALLRCGREFWLLGGVVQFGVQHPFFHHFEPLEELTPQQQQLVVQKSAGKWPPPSEGMLCIAEFFMEADGDQILFDVSGGLVNGEYPVMYYAHESLPPSVRRLADTLPEFLASFLGYSGLRRED